MKACNACGKCCIKYGNGRLSASDEDINLWDGLRPEIASYVKEGDIWFDPENGVRLKMCPWLRPVEGSSAYHCDIYYDRPEDCRIYPATVADMIKDDCEMIESNDLKDLKNAEIRLSQIHIADR
jgi:Fe-S-cluster containining protein